MFLRATSLISISHENPVRRIGINVALGRRGEMSGKTKKTGLTKRSLNRRTVLKGAAAAVGAAAVGLSAPAVHAARSLKVGVYGGYLPWGDRAGRFRSLGDGETDWTGIFTKLAKYFLQNGEGWAVRSANVMTEKDPTRIKWQILPDGDHGSIVFNVLLILFHHNEILKNRLLWKAGKL